MRLAILLTDVVGSTELVERLGDVRAAELRVRHDRIARDLLRMHGGREIDKADGFLAIFHQADEAVAFAAAYHAALRTLDPPMESRIGLHVGDVVLSFTPDDDVAVGAKPVEVDGLAKSLAARVMNLAAGRQTLLTDSARQAVTGGARIESHGFFRMKGLSDPVEVFEIGHDGAPFTPPPDGAKAWRVVQRDGLWVSARSMPHSLPAERDRFVGRSADLDALARRLDDGDRLVTVLGIGGTGKTRLVTRYGWGWMGDWPGGVWFCDLADARTLDGIVFSVANALGVPLGKGDAVVQLGSVLSGRGPCLVVLDNFEQIVALAASTVGRWLDSASGARFVVTSREVLNLPGEQVLALPPLDRAAAADLFTARARSANSAFDADDGESVAELVALLDHLPLAIELAAARARAFSASALLARMGQRFALLGGRGRVGRQATLRAAIDWSWDLLTAEERAALAQLSVFDGGCSLEAAEAVLDLPGGELVAEVLAGLVDKSMVRVIDDRFEMLVSVQEYAAEKLAASGSAEVERRHGAWAATFADATDLVRGSHSPAVRMIDHARDVGNLVTATRRAVARNDVGVAIDTVLAAGSVLATRGPHSLELQLYDEVLAVSPGHERVRARRARALWRSGRTSEARAEFVAIRAAAEARGDEAAELRDLVALAGLTKELGQPLEARALLEDALRRLPPNGSDRTIALDYLGLVLSEIGDYDGAQTSHERALVLAREQRDRDLEAHSLNHLGVIHAMRGRMDEARIRFQAALAVARDGGSRRFEATVRSNLGNTESVAGDHVAAAEQFRESIRQQAWLGDRRSEGIARGNLGNSLRVLGDPEGARELARALAIHRDLGFQYGQPYWLSGLALIASADGRHAEARALADEAVAVGAKYPGVQAEALAQQARVRIAAGDLAGARASIAQGLGLGQRGKAGALLHAADALLAAIEGDDLAVEAALSAATADPALCRPGSEVAGVIAAVPRRSK